MTEEIQQNRTEEDMAAEAGMLRDIFHRLIANRPIPVGFGAMTFVIADIAENISSGAREFMASELERLALHIRNLPTETQPEPAPVGNQTLN